MGVSDCHTRAGFGLPVTEGKPMLLRHLTHRMAIIPLVLSCTLAAPNDEWTEHHDAGWEAHERGEYAEAERLLRLALGEVEELGKDDPRVAGVLNSLARVLTSRAKF